MQENEVRTELVIPAPIDAVWRVLVDFAGYAKWNPVMEYTQVDGVHTKVKAAKGTPFERDFDGEITSADKYVLASQGGDPETFFGRHRWELSEVAGGTRLVNVETFTGAMAADVLAQTREVLVAEFDAFNQALLGLFAER
ncbi:Polyketide cyclase / dehydrase and lipid transport [Lentzea waywayandensis]|uniref:Polyketide cyclase / dehydrase and lipid transport n=1 Tax=Lentzea waywayandensis TaxID=84724 RepID=A0A1I6EBR3_9PSEU|nr:SRPBCC domain-containing protein [Lentzea waywayandensis]SFR14938.1 Polyketide cyclase / dehydrase and lipid transport [Lentzea waywayandensis]